MITVTNKTDRWSYTGTRTSVCVPSTFSYDYEKQKRKDVFQRVVYNCLSSPYAYFGALTYNDKSIIRSFDYECQDGTIQTFWCPLNLQNHPVTQNFFKRLQQTCKRLYNAKLRYSYICEQGEGGITHNYVGVRGKNNNPHVHFVLYSDKLIPSHHLNILVKYFWQGHKKEIKSNTATFYEKYAKTLITKYSNALYGRAGLNMDVNNGYIDTRSPAGVAGYVTDYVTKDDSAEEYNTIQKSAIIKQYMAIYAVNGVLDLDHKQELTKILRKFSTSYAPRSLHSNGVGLTALSSQYYNVDDFTISSFKAENPRESLCPYLKRKELYKPVKHPFKKDVNGRDMIVYKPTDKYLKYKMSTLQDSILRTKEKYDHLILYYPSYYEEMQSVYNDNMLPFIPDLNPDTYKLAIYDLIYKGRRFNSNDIPTIDPVIDSEWFILDSIQSDFSNITVDKVPFYDLGYDEYNNHPYFADESIGFYSEYLSIFANYYRNLETKDWQKQRQQIRLTRIAIKNATGQRLTRPQ